MRDEIRESWLEAAVAEWTPVFTRAGYPLPPVRVSCGFGWRHKDATRGQCIPAVAAADGRAQIFVDPRMDDPLVVLQTLVHELVHAADGCQNGHRGPFREIAKAVGLQGPRFTASDFSPSGREMAAAVLERIGTYPHAHLSLESRAKQQTRMVKVTCRRCGYTLRATRTWLESVGAPRCACSLVEMRPEGVNARAVDPADHEAEALRILKRVRGDDAMRDASEVARPSASVEVLDKELRALVFAWHPDRRREPLDPQAVVAELNRVRELVRGVT